jgi:hypothetical protein
MIDLMKENIMSLAEATKHVPPSRGGRKTHLSTILRWVVKGVKGVRLEAVRLGGRWVTSEQALQRFAERSTPNLADPHLPRSPKQRDTAFRRAERRLEKAGIS